MDIIEKFILLKQHFLHPAKKSKIVITRFGWLEDWKVFWTMPPTCVRIGATIKITAS